MPWDLILKELNANRPVGPADKSTFIERLWRVLGFDTTGPRVNSVAFTIALVALSAKLAKSDGVALPVESQAFERLHKISPADQGSIRRMFETAAQDVAGFDTYAERVAELLRRDPILMRDVLEGLFHIAGADGILHPEEERHLRRASETFGFDEQTFRSIRARFINDPDDPYTLLGLDPAADATTIKARYREFVREYHPDRQIARGLPKEYVEIATSRLAAINAAYDRIAKERGL